MAKSKTAIHLLSKISIAPQGADPSSASWWCYAECLAWVSTRDRDMVRQVSDDWHGMSEADRRRRIVMNIVAHAVGTSRIADFDLTGAKEEMQAAIRSGQLTCLGRKHGVGDHGAIPEAHTAVGYIHDGSSDGEPFLAPVSARPEHMKWHDLLFKRAQVEKIWPPKPSNSYPSFSHGALDQWYRDRVQAWSTSDPPPSRAKDEKAAAEHFGRRIPRDAVREARRNHAPPSWHRGGRPKSTPKPAGD